MLRQLDVGAEASRAKGRRLYDAAVAMRDIMTEFGMAVDGGKDSLSMAARVTNPEDRRDREIPRNTRYLRVCDLS